MAISSFKPDSFTTFGDLLKYLRRREQLTQLELSIAVGYSEAQISRLEKNQRLPDLTALKALFIPAFHLEADSQLAQRLLELAQPAKIEEPNWSASKGSPRTNLPASITSLVGRERDIAETRGYLSAENIRLVTLIGPPGIGKTRLSIAVARDSIPDYPDGVIFVPLAPLDDPGLVAPTIIQALGFVETRNQAPLERLKEGIEEKHILLVLDNLEHLLDSAASLISELLPACPGLKILTTSREALRLPGEWLYPVPALKLPPETPLQPLDPETALQSAALSLFAERARAVSPEFTLNAGNLQAVASICRQLDGLPLAIELLAARMRLMTPQILLARMKDTFPLHTDGLRAVIPRQKTLHNAIGWSYDLLSEEEQRFFAYLSIFRGGFTLDLAEAVFSQASFYRPVIDLVASLLDKSLIQQPSNAQYVPRFSMLVTIQQFAAQRLREAGEEPRLRELHLACFLELAEKAEAEIHGPNQIEWMNRLDREQDNFRAALEWSISELKTEQSLRLLTALGWQWVIRWNYNELFSWFEKLRLQPEIGAHPLIYARLLVHIGHARWISGDFPLARSILEESQEIGLQAGASGERGLADALNYLGQVTCLGEADYNRAQQLFEQSYEIYQKLGDKRGMAIAISNLCAVARLRNQDAAAISLGEESLDLYRQLGDLWGISISSQNLGRTYLNQGNYEIARPFLEQHLTIDQGLNFKPGIVVALSSFGNFYRYQGDDAQAEHFYEASLALCREIDYKWEISNNFFFLGLLALHRNDYPLARQYFFDYFEIARRLYFELSAIDLCTGLAAVAAGMGQPEYAAKLSGAAQAIPNTRGYAFDPFDRLEFDRLIQIARSRLGNDVFETFASEGRSMTIDQAVAYALGPY